MNCNQYPLVAVALSPSFCRLRLVHSEEEFIRFVRDFKHRADLLYTVPTLEALYRQRLEYITAGH